MYRKLTFYTVILLFLVQTLLFGSELQLNEKEKKWLKNHPIIKVSNEDDWPPYDFSVNGKAQGYSIDIVKLLADKIGLKVKFVNGFSWEQLLQEFDHNHIDLMHCISKTEAREKKYSFSEPYMPWRLSYFVRENNFDIHPPNDFTGKKIAAGKAWSTTKLIKDLYPNAEIIEFKNSSLMIEALITSKVDILIDNTHVVNYIMRENLLSGIKHVGYINLKDKFGMEFYFVAHKKDTPLTSIFTKAFNTLTPCEKDKLQNKWFSSYSPKKDMNHGSLSNKRVSKINFTTHEKEYLKKKKVVTMCIDPQWMPYEGFNKDGQYIGISADFFKIFQKDIGTTIKVVHTKSWAESLNYAKERKCDILSLAMETPSRKKYLNFTTPYLNMPLVMATKANVVFFDDFELLKGKKIGIVKGYAFNEIMRQKYPNFEIVNVENIEEGLNKVVSGELFGYIDTLPSIGYMFQIKYIGELKIAGKFDEKWKLGIGVRNDDPLLLEVFEKAIRHVPSDVRHKLIFKTIAIKYDQHMDYWLIAKIIGGSILLIAFMFYHNRKLSRMNQRLAELQDKLQEQVNRDPMTNLYNRRYFHEISLTILELAQREKQKLSLIMIDIDNFKRINDTYGHAIGDVVIKKVAILLQKSVRSSDIVSRFGGEEFIILLPNTDLKGAANIASKMREAVEQMTLVYGKTNIKFTISLGVATLSSYTENIESLLNKADEALYRAKERGKNQTVIYEENIDS